MTRSFSLPITNKGQVQVHFPQRCANCGAAATTTSVLAVTKAGQSGRKRGSIQARLDVPHCEACARSTRAIFLAGLVPFLLGLLATGGVVMALVTFTAWKFNLDQYGQPNNANSLILGAAAGLFAGLAGGLIAEVLARFLLAPFLGRALLGAPLLAMQLLGDSDHVAGLSAKPSAMSNQVTLTFSNADVAQEFEEINREVLVMV